MYLIIPGLGGSKIYCNCNSEQEPVKLYPKLFGSLDEHFFDAACKTSTKPLRSYFGISVYRTLEKRLGRAGFDVQYFSYDWRKSPLEAAQRLSQYLTNLTHVNDLQQPIGKDNDDATITLIGHSNGGYILRILFEYLNYPRDAFRHIIIFGTPFFGQPELATYNKEFQLYKKMCSVDQHIKTKSILFSEQDMNAIFKHFKTTLAFFLPTTVFLDESVESVSAKIHTNLVDVYIVSQIHKQLSQMRTQKYIFVFNVSQKMPQKIPYARTAMEFALREFPGADSLTKDGRVYTHCDGDTVVCSPRNVLNNTIYDSTPLPHSMAVNSSFFFECLKRLRQMP